jgi:hypothetical protein
MRKRLKTIGAAVVALAALALGGSAIASATQHTAAHVKKHAGAAVTKEKTGGPDTDKIQSGDQTTPDVSSAARPASTSTSKGSAGVAGSETASETSSETSSESSTPSDGPGGHEDPAGEVGTQGEGQE